MVFVLFRERFHGQMIPKPFFKEFKTLAEARKLVASWNSLGDGDKLFPVAVYPSLKNVIGVKKTKYDTWEFVHDDDAPSWSLKNKAWEK